MDTERINTKALQRDIKRAKLFAIQHLTRRVKMLKNKRGTEQQVEKNTRKASRFEEELEYLKELNIDIVLEKIQNKDFTDSKVAAEIQQRALDRLISSKPIQGHLEQSKTEKTTSTKNPGSSKKSSSKLQPKQEHFIQPCISPPCSASDNDSVQSDIELERPPSSFFIESLSTEKKREHPAGKRGSKSEKQKENNLNSKSRNDKKVQKERKKSSNRMGQRARQRLWKEQYGKKAKHIKAGDKMTKHKTREKLTANENHQPKKEERTKRGVKRQQKSLEEAALSHPSWEASKRRKLQQNISETKFQGQKITFDDSD